MQSGISGKPSHLPSPPTHQPTTNLTISSTASQELQTAFLSLLSSSTDRGLIVSISTSPEVLVPSGTIQSTSSDFKADLENLQPFVEDNVAAYYILKENVGNAGKGAGSGCVAITYVPEKAPVRSKMLFASTRLTLARELGNEHFPASLIATSPNELSPAGWTAHQAHTSLSAPLTSEEQSLVSIREASASESTGTSARSGGHVSKAKSLPISEEGATALTSLRDGALGLIQLRIDVAREVLELAGTEGNGLGPESVAGVIGVDGPRYTYYRHDESGCIVFIYTCPSTSSIKERMVYAASRLSMVQGIAPDHGIDLRGKLEATDPVDITGAEILAELGILKAEEEATTAASAGSRAAFARPKRPGKR